MLSVRNMDFIRLKMNIPHNGGTSTLYFCHGDFIENTSTAASVLGSPDSVFSWGLGNIRYPLYIQPGFLPDASFFFIVPKTRHKKLQFTTLSASVKTVCEHIQAFCTGLAPHLKSCTYHVLRGCSSSATKLN